jgi:ABC-type multidrug transport system fused ATPase/permease subunit
MSSALDAVFPADLRRLSRVAGVRWQLIAGALLMFLSAWGLVAAPWLIGKAVNDIGRHDTHGLIVVAVAVAGAGVLTAGATAAGTWLLGRSAITAGMRIRARVHDRLLLAPSALYRMFPTGQLVARATADVEPIKLLLTSGVSVAVQFVGSIAFALAIMFLIDTELALIAISPLPLAVIAQLRYAKTTRAATAVAEQRRGEVAAEAADNVISSKLIMSLGREAQQRMRFDHAVENLFIGWLRVGRLDAVHGSALAIVPYIGLGLVLAFGGRAVLDGRISLGEFVTFYGFLGMLAAGAGQVSFLTYLTAGAAGSATRIVELLDYPGDVSGGADLARRPLRPPRLELRDVWLTYAAEAPLRGVTIDVEGGETVALVGVTGAGMATVLELVNGLIAPERGTLRVDGDMLDNDDFSSLRRLSAPSGVGRLFAMSIADNIAYGKPGAGMSEIENAARRAQAHEFVTAFTDGYNTQLGEGGAQLSGGQRQRIALARALLAGRPLLLLDDVTSALDPESANRVLAGLSAASGSATTLLSTHGAAALRLADRIVAMDGGHVIGAGTHEELLQSCAPYRQMVELWKLS